MASGDPVTCSCGRMRLPGRPTCGRHGADWDDEMAEAMEHLDEMHRAAKALSDVFVANADHGNDEANTAMMQEMLRRVKAAGPPRDRDC